MMSKQREPIWFHLPIDSGQPPLISSAVDFEKLVARPSGSYRSQINVFDSPQARLLRCGVTVALRRHDDEPGQWYVAAPGWVGLPEEETYPVDATGDLPVAVAKKLKLILRTHELAPFASLNCDRRAFTLRGAQEDLMEISEDQITVNRAGEVIARFREIVLRPLVKLSGQQISFLTSAMDAVSATRLMAAPTLASRIGPPATGPSPYRVPTELRKDMTLEEMVGERFRAHLNQLLSAELRDDRQASLQELAEIKVTLRGFSAVLDPAWREQSEAKVVSAATANKEEREAAIPNLMEDLVSAVRAPKLGDLARLEASVVLYARLEQQVVILFDRCRALEVDSPDEAWGAALRSARQLDASMAVLEPMWPKGVKRLRAKHADLLTLLESSMRPAEDVDLVGLSPEEAFRLGRDIEHAQWAVSAARREMIATWPSHVKSGRKSLAKMKKKLS